MQVYNLFVYVIVIFMISSQVSAKEITLDLDPPVTVVKHNLGQFQKYFDVVGPPVKKEVTAGVSAFVKSQQREEQAKYLNEYFISVCKQKLETQTKVDFEILDTALYGRESQGISSAAQLAVKVKKFISRKKVLDYRPTASKKDWRTFRISGNRPYLLVTKIRCISWTAPREPVVSQCSNCSERAPFKPTPRVVIQAVEAAEEVARAAVSGDGQMNPVHEENAIDLRHMGDMQLQSEVAKGDLTNGFTRRKYQGGSTEFLQYANAGDGDCGLHGLGVSRIEFVDKLNAEISKGSAQAAWIIPHLKTDVYNHCNATTKGDDNAKFTICGGILDYEWTRGPLDNQFSTFISQQLKRSSEYLSFIRASDAGAVGTLPLAAKLFGKKVRVWESKGGRSLNFKAGGGADGGSEINLLFTGGNHYEKLIRPDDVAARQAARAHEAKHFPRQAKTR